MIKPSGLNCSSLSNLRLVNNFTQTLKGQRMLSLFLYLKQKIIIENG